MPQEFDRLLKSLAGDDPRALYHLRRMPLPPPDAVIQPMVQEVSTSLTAMDYWYTVNAGAESWADVFEFKSRYESGMQKQLFQYCLRAYLLKDLPVRGTLIVVTPAGFPQRYQEISAINVPGLFSAQFDTVKLWETEADVALDSGRPGLLSLVPFMKARWDQLVRAGRAVRDGTEDALQWFWKAARIKYAGRVLEQLSEEVGMPDAVMERIFRELLPYSPWVQEARDEARHEGLQEGLQEGRQEGRHEGELTEARRMVRILLSARFPEVEAPASLDAASDLDAIHQVANSLARAGSADDAKAALSSLQQQA